ncbi:hypothetical protein IACHDJAJ_00040 [Aeromonas phage vB_AdhS_TS3]|nr:hypothetical protein IACHDJAJ_00040 [Aeromonas phage vB_AdhS_TS3]
MIYFTSDLHHRHRNILNVCPEYRPWESREAMTEGLIEYHNDIVKETDTLYILGDFSFGKAAYTLEILGRMTGNKVIIRGNHDEWLDKVTEEQLLEVGVANVRDLYCRKFEGKKIVMCHYAIRAWQDQGRGSLHIYGHSHGNLEGFGRSMDVGWDAWGRYLLLEEVIDRLESKEIEVADHHKIILE